MTEKEIQQIRFELNRKYSAEYINWFDIEWRKDIGRLKAAGLDLSKIPIIGSS